MSSVRLVPIRELPAWKALATHYEKIRELHLRELFDDDPTRKEYHFRFVIDDSQWENAWNGQIRVVGTRNL